jgi:multidrug resistance efflux pump
MRIISLMLGILLAACGADPESMKIETGKGDAIIKVTGELRSANPHYFGPPAISDTWQFTIAFMAPDGALVKAGSPILKFDAQDLMTKVRDKENSLNEKQKELKKQKIVSREQLSDLKLAQAEAIADRDKAALKADIPDTLLARREYRENQLILEQAELMLLLRAEELEKEARIQETEQEILEREIGVLQADIARLQHSIGVMTINAPGNGVVIHAVGRHNNKASVGDNVWRGRRVIEFPDLEQLVVFLEVPERESARIAVGQSVKFILDAAPDRQFEGKIVELASVIHSRSRNQPARVFDATVELQILDPELMRPGMSVNAEIDVGPGAGTGL